MKKYTLGVSLLTLTFIASISLGDGYRNPPPTAVGIAKAGAHSVFVDDASAISYNPANLSLQTNRSVVASITLAQLMVDYSPTAGLTFESETPFQPLPNLYMSSPIGDRGSAIGFAITTPYGQGSEWKKSDFESVVTTDPVPYDATMGAINFSPTFSAMLTDNIAVGAGIDIMYSFVELNALLPTGGPILDSKGEGDGWGVGANLGLTWLLTENQRVTFTYHSQQTVNYKGDFEIEGTDSGDFSTKIKFPNMYSLGYGIELAQKFQIEAMVEFIEWSENDVLPLNAGVLGSLPQVNNWDDTFTIGFGATWLISDSFALHGGYGFFETPVPDESLTPLLANADRHVLGLGLGYTFGAHTVDISYAFTYYDDREVTAGAAPGLYEIDSNLIGLTYSASF